MKVDILAIGVHPDDVELSCSGTIFRHLDKGYRVAVLDLTHGELGTRGSGELRLQEAAKASKIMGISHRTHLDISDGFFRADEINKKKIARVVRQFRPEIVLANAIDDRHPDHGRAAKLIYDACFIAGLVKVETKDDEGNIQKRWRPRAIYHYIQDKILIPDLVVDITPYLSKKMESILAYRSQFYDPNNTEPDSPISGQDFLDYIKARARVHGRQIGVDYGEGFNVTRVIGTDDLLNLI